MEALKYLLYGVHFLISLALIILVVSQTARHEGLGSVGGGASQPSLRGRAGVEEQLQGYTRWAAVAFMIMSALLFIAAERYNWA